MQLWNNQSKYFVNNTVINDNKSYICNTTHTASSTFFEDIENWDLLNQGATGATGANSTVPGPTGPQGTTGEKGATGSSSNSFDYTFQGTVTGVSDPETITLNSGEWVFWTPQGSLPSELLY